MIHRNLKIVNYRFQLKILFSILALLFLFFGTSLYFIHRNTRINQRLTQTAVAELNQTVAAEEAIVKSFIKFASAISNRRFDLKTDLIRKDHDASVEKIRNAISRMESITARNNRLMLIITVLFVIQTLFIIVYIISLTHRIYGPIHVMNTMLAEATRGKALNRRKLRKGDEFQTFYENFSAYIEKQHR